MSQLYARVFLQILDSSIAEDFTTRHIFEDLLKLSEDGIVDMTREALSRRINCSLKLLNDCLNRLEAPDHNSRDQEFEGRRIQLLDEHRNWGWRILNWEKYEQLRTRADVAIRQNRFREKHAEFRRPDLEQVKLCATKAGLPEIEAEKFFNHYESNGWRVGRNPMKSLPHAIANWKSNWQKGVYSAPNGSQAKQEPLWSRIKSVEALIEEKRRKLPSVANRNLYPEQYAKDVERRKPFLEELERLKKKREALLKEQANQ